MPRTSRKAAAKKQRGKFEFVAVRVHRYGWDNLTRIANTLKERATCGVGVPVRLDLGNAHLFDAMTDVCAKVWNVDPPETV